VMSKAEDRSQPSTNLAAGGCRPGARMRAGLFQLTRQIGRAGAVGATYATAILRPRSIVRSSLDELLPFGWRPAACLRQEFASTSAPRSESQRHAPDPRASAPAGVSRSPGISVYPGSLTRRRYA
jgi:hypothetical protein